MASRRTVQVGKLIKEELSGLLQREVKDPGLGFVTLTEVKVSPDLRSAQVYFSVLGDEAVAEESLSVLRRAAGFLRSELAGRLALRYIPELNFVLDRSIEHGQRIESLLRQIRDESSSEE
jgi:ribosome-binding factor A